MSHVTADPPGSAPWHPNKENESKEKEYGRQSGRVITTCTHAILWIQINSVLSPVTDDSEEWAHDDDDDEPLSSLIEEDPAERSVHNTEIPILTILTVTFRSRDC